MEADTAALEQRPLDTLGYYDTEYDDAYWKERTHNEIQEELYRMENEAGASKQDYLGQKGLHPHKLHFKQGSILAAEYARVKAGVPMKRLDDSRYAVAAPSNAKSQQDPEAWGKANANAKAQLQHQLSRQLNLELLGIHGGNAWLHHNKVSTSHASEHLRPRYLLPTYLIHGTAECCPFRYWLLLRRQRQSQVNG